MDTAADGIPTSQEASYSIISYPGQNLPMAYRAMILSKWLRSLRYGNDYFKLIDSDSYFAVYQKYIEVLINRSNSIVRLAVLSDDHDVVLGWSLTEGSALHYFHVQHDQRNKGIGKSLVPIKVKYISHLTKKGMNIWHKSFPDAKFNPFL